MAANLIREGVDARCLEETPASIRQSMRFNSGQCIPLNIIAQEFIDYVQSHGLKPAQTALWMTVGEIACNIKLYPHYIKNILNAYGHGMEQADVYRGELSMFDISVTLPVNNYLAYMFGGMIRKIGCKIRPFNPVIAAHFIIILLYYNSFTFLTSCDDLASAAKPIKIFELGEGERS